jgi:hypothetical protein
MGLAGEPMSRVTRVTAFILVTDIRDQCLRALHLDLECGNQRIFRVHDDVASLALQLETNGKLQLRASLSGAGRDGADCAAALAGLQRKGDDRQQVNSGAGRLHGAALPCQQSEKLHVSRLTPSTAALRTICHTASL